jgi:DNA-binding GntR family transcriptional regulator
MDDLVDYRRRSQDESVDDAPRPSGEDLSQIVTSKLEEDIVFGRLYPRERLIEEELVERFSVKRHVIRQALMQLERLGLVERSRNRGAMVRLYSIQEVEDINAVRQLLETHAASLIPLPLSEPALARLEVIHRQHASAIETGERQTVFRANIAFHKELFSHCGNHALIEAIDLFAQKSHAYRSIFINDKDSLRWAADAHMEMIAAIRNNDRERFVSLCRAHLSPAKNRYIEMYRGRD